ncbi:MAG: putative maltokinase [Bryobacteraceae bacterium]
MAHSGTPPQPSKSALPTVDASFFDTPFSGELLTRLLDLLPDFVRSRRWFRAKTRTISKIDIEDAIPFAEVDSSLLVLRIVYYDGEEDRYILPLSLAENSEHDRVAAPAFEPIAVLQSSGERRVLYSAIANPKFRSALLDAIATSARIPGRKGEFNATRVHTPSGSEPTLDANLESSVSRAEQSNTSVIYGQQLILKLFRKVEPGINPDIEIGAFLTEHGFKNTPAVLATVEYRSGDELYAAGILQKFVPNKGDAWSYTLGHLNDFFSRALKQEIPESQKDVAQVLSTLIGNYREGARLLGQRTAEMHRVLSSPTDSSDFAPEPFTEADGKKLQSEMLKQADIAFNLLREKQSDLPEQTRDVARQLLALEDQVRQLFSPLADAKVGADRIRFHGDYHLGQVLFTGDDFMIIDFEGEPARPLHERREKTLALRDVAGMLRSFQYAAFAALFGQVPAVSVQPGSDEQIKRWATLWNDSVGREYLSSYFETAGDARFVPHEKEEQKRVLEAFLLHKALYEVAYELNNRPDWVEIPLRGILRIVR